MGGHERERDVLTVLGRAVVPGQPDEVQVGLHVTHLAKTPEDALAEAARRSQALSAVLDDLGVPPEGRTTSGASVAPEVVWEKDRQVHKGFRASQRLVVRLAEAEQVARLMRHAVARAEAEVQGPWWRLSLDHPARMEALRRAAENARRKADAYAGGLGLRVGAVLRAREPESEPVRPRGEMMLMSADRSAAQPAEMAIDPGELDVSAEVIVTFELRPGA